MIIRKNLALDILLSRHEIWKLFFASNLQHVQEEQHNVHEEPDGAKDVHVCVQSVPFAGHQHLCIHQNVLQRRDKYTAIG